jgi:hypothetical protein
MAPSQVKKLVNTQVGQIQLVGERLSEHPAESFTMSQLQSRRDSINATWAAVKATNTELIGRNMDPSEPYISEDCFARIYAVYEEMRDRLFGMLNKVTGASEFMASSSTNSTGLSITLASIAKLPRINLPSFSGRYEDWESFKDLFSSLVHDVASLPDSTKL